MSPRLLPRCAHILTFTRRSKLSKRAVSRFLCESFTSIERTSTKGSSIHFNFFDPWTLSSIGSPSCYHIGIGIMSTAEDETTAVVPATPKNQEESEEESEEKSEHLNFWWQRWTEQRIGWHNAEVNDILTMHGDKLFVKGGNDNNNNNNNKNGIRVLVPLCGKSKDMVFLTEQDSVAEVVGCDGIEQAIQEFAQENPHLNIQETTTTNASGFKVFEGTKIRLLKGDFFALSSHPSSDIAVAGGKFDAVFDRGSLVAIQPEMRLTYINVIQQLVAPGARILLVAVEHGDVGVGPPFCLDKDEVHRLFGNTDWVESITQLNPENTEVDDRDRLSRWYLIQVRQ